ncbi:hypothetical protein ACP4OV_030800 [Aristida adscensionis]
MSPTKTMGALTSLSSSMSLAIVLCLLTLPISLLGATYLHSEPNNDFQ